MRRRVLHRIAAPALAMISMSACGSLSGAKAPPPPIAQAPAAPDAVAPLLELMSSLPQGDPARQAEVFQRVKDAVDLSPTTSNRLRYALALATPGYSGTDPVAAERQLSELLSRPETLLPSEHSLASVELKEVEQTLVLQAENKRMRDEAPHDSHDKVLAINRRLTAEADENTRLRKALDEALAKLDAISHVERSINDRSTTESRSP